MGIDIWVNRYLHAISYGNNSKILHYTTFKRKTQIVEFLPIEEVSVMSQRGTQYKRTYGDVPPPWVANSASWYEWPLIKCQIWYMKWVDFSKFSQIWAKIVQLGKFWKNQVIMLKIWSKIDIWMGHFFWNTGICVGLLSNSAAAHLYQNQTWLPPRVWCQSTHKMMAHCVVSSCTYGVQWAYGIPLCLSVYLSIRPQLEKMLPFEYALIDFHDTWIWWSSGGETIGVFRNLGSKVI